MAASEAQLLAPQEIQGEKGAARGELVGAEERTETDRRRERRKKKAKQGAIYRSVYVKVYKCSVSFASSDLPHAHHVFSIQTSPLTVTPKGPGRSVPVIRLSLKADVF